MMELLTDPAAWTAFLTLAALEMVLGIDNIIFIAILAEKLPPAQRNRARQLGLALALFLRLGLLFMLSWIIGLTAPFFTVLSQEISGRDLILIGGGLFLIWKSTREVHQLLEGEEGERSASVPATFGAVLVQIILIDAVFSLDSIITAVGMVDELPIMVAAVVVAVALMMVAAGPIATFVARRPTIKILALSFLFVVGVVLIVDGFDHHVPKGYIYFAMAFSLMVEMLNLRLRGTRVQPVDLREPYSAEPSGDRKVAS